MIIRIAFSLMATLLAFSASAADLTDAQRAAIEERIKPVGESCMEGDSSCGGAAAAAASSGARSGEDVYNAACMACHSTGAAGAPRTGDAAAWAPRIAKGMDTLVSNAINGLNTMPPKGLCMACSDDDLRGVVEYIVGQSQ